MAKRKSVAEIEQELKQKNISSRISKLGFSDSKKLSVNEIYDKLVENDIIKKYVPERQTEPTQSVPQAVSYSSPAAALAAKITRHMGEQVSSVQNTAFGNMSKSPSLQEVQDRADRVNTIRAGAARRSKDTTVYDKALDMLKQYTNSGAPANNSSIEELQKHIDKPVVSMDDINLDDPDVVSSYLNHDRNAVQFFNDYRIGKLSHSEDNVERYNNLLNTIEAKVNNVNNANARYSNSTEIAMTDEFGDKVNYGDLMRIKAAQNRIADVDISQKDAAAELDRISDGNRNLTGAPAISGDQLRSAGWDISGESVAIPVEAYQDEIHNNAAVFSPIVKDESGNVVRILSPQELEEYAKDVLNGGADKLGLKATDTYKGMYAASLANENASRIRRLGERYYNDTDFWGLLQGVPDESRKKELNEKGVDYDEYSTYAHLLKERQTNEERTKAYANWSAQNVGTGSAATAANILMSPIQAVEYLQNLGENLTGHIKAGTNELSAYRLPNIYNDVTTNLSEESTGAITEAIRSGIRGNGDNAFINSVADVAANTYGGVTSGIQSALTYGTLSLFLSPEVASGIALGTMSAQAANGAYHDVIKNGGTVGQAITYSAAAGLNEYLGEKLSLDNLINITATAGKQTAKDILLSVLGQGIVEGTEEVTTEALNEFTDRLINADKSEYERVKQNYIANGYSEEDAASKASTDFLARVGWAAYGGFVGGLLPGAGKVATNTIKSNINERRAGKYIRNAGNAQALIDLAEQSANEKIKAQARALRTLNTKPSTGNAIRDRIRNSRTQKRAGQLWTQLQKSNIEQFGNAEQSVRLEAIENLYAEQINDTERKDPTVSKVAKLIDKAVTGQTLTEREQKTVSSPSAQAVINKIKEDKDLLESQTKAAKSKALSDYAKAQKLVMPKETETINDEDVDTGEFIISDKDDGKVYKDNEVVETGAITDISGDNIKVEIGNGNTESVKALSMPAEQAVLYQSLMDVQNETGIQFTPTIANDIVSLAQSAGNDLSLSQSVRAAKQTLVKGYTNNSNEYSSDSYASKLSDSTRQKFYDLGRELASAQTAEQQQRVLDKVSAQDNQREGTVTFEDDIDRNKLDRRRKASVDYVEAYAKVHGTDVVFFESKPDGKGRRSSKFVTENRLKEDGGQAPNGFWHNGKIYIDINAGVDGEGLILFTMSHELVHMIREGSPEDYKALADFLVSKYAEKGIDIDDLVRLKMEQYGAPKYLAMKEMGKSTNLTYDEALEEVIADSCESFILDLADAKRGAQISQQLKKENPTLWERIKDALYNILQRVRNAYRLAKPQSREAQIIAQMKDIIEPAYEIYVRGYTNAARNLRNMEGDRQSGTKFSIRKTQNMDYTDQLEQIEKRELNGSNSLYLGTPSDSLQKIGLSNAPFAMNQADYRKARRKSGNNKHYSSHSVPYDFFESMPDKLSDIGMAIDNGNKVTLVTDYIMNDTNGNKAFVIAGIWQNQPMESDIVNHIKSVYPLDDTVLRLKEAAEKSKLVVINEKKAENMLTTIGVQPSEVSSILNLAKNSLSQPVDNVKRQSRTNGYDFGSFDIGFGEEEIEDTLAREFETHHEDIGEVLRNTADIEITAAKVNSIVNRIIKNNLGEIDSKSRELLSLEIQIALDQVNRKDAEAVTNDIISSVRDAIENAKIVDERSEDNYNKLRQYFGNDRYYLTDKMLAYLGMSLGDYRKRMFGKINIVKQGTPNAKKLSLESMHEVLDAPDEYLGFSADEWDSHEEDTPVILMDAFDKLKDRRMVSLTEYIGGEQELDDRAVELAAKITGAIIQEKYNSRKNPYVSKLVENLRAKRAEAVKKQKEKNRKKLAELKQKERERADKREQELKEQYQEQRANALEGRQRTELRQKIRKLTESLQKRLTKPKGQQYVPRELIAQTVDVLNAINLDTGRSTRLSEKLALVRTEYDKLEKENEAGAMYDPVISEALLNVTEDIKGVNIMDMSLRQLKSVYDVIRSMDYVIRESVKMTDTKFKQDAHQLGRNWIAEIRAVPKEHSGAASGWIQTMLSPERFFDRIAGFKKNSTPLQLYNMLNDGQLRMIQLEMEFTQIFDELIKDSKQLKSLYDTKNLVDIGLVDEDGNKVEITRGMMISLYMHLLNEDNTRHVMGGGLIVPDMKDYYKGDIAKAYGKGMQRVRVGALDYSRYAEGIKSVIENELSDYEIAWIKAAHDFFDVASRKALNDTTMKLYGFKRANVDNYFPIHTSSNYRAANFEAIQRDMYLENIGLMKERVKASNPIFLEDIVDVVNHQISQVSKYCGMTLPIKNFQKVYSTTLRDYDASVQEVLDKKFSETKNNTGAKKYIANLIADLTFDRSTDDGPIAKRLGKMRGFLAQSTLTLNPRVAIAQTASIPTAAPIVGWDALTYAMSHKYRAVTDDMIAEITPLFWLRRQGYATLEIGDINELRKQKHKVQGKVSKALNWINAMDSFAVRRLFVASEYYVQKNYKDLKPGTDEYKLKLSEVYNKVIERTQPNYTTLQRPDILRNPNALVKSLTMFMTQRLQNFNIVYDAAGRYIKYKSDFKKGLNGVTEADKHAAGVELRRAVVSQLVASSTIVLFKLAADALLHSMNGYRDDDDELTTQSLSLGLLNNFADTILGNFLFASDLYSFGKALFSRGRYDGLSMAGVDSFNSLLSSMVNFGNNVFLSIKGEKKFKNDYIYDLALSLSQVLGVPMKNAEKIVKAVVYHIEDFNNGEPLSFESGVDRTHKQDIHRIELAYNGGDKEKANKIKADLLKTQTDKGKTEKEALSWLRGGFTATYKQQYIDAVKNNDTEKIKNIREFLLFTGVYGTLSEQDKAMQKWLKGEE